MIAKHRLPNVLTIARVVMVALMLLFFMLLESGAWFVTGLLFLLASLTDWLDGKLARQWQVQSAFGTMLDPVADKVLVMAALLLLLASGMPVLLPSCLILAREILISGLREYLGGKDITMPVSTLAKWKTATQMVALQWLLWLPLLPFPLGAHALLWVAVGLTWWTAAQYCRAAWPHLRQPG